MLTMFPHQTLYIAIRTNSGDILFARLIEPYGPERFKILILNRGHTAFITREGTHIYSFSMTLENEPVDLLWQGDVPEHINPVRDCDAALDWVMVHAWRNPVHTALRDRNDEALRNAAEILCANGHADLGVSLRAMTRHANAPDRRKEPAAC
ncbi:hypothetical protein ACOI1H_19130 [Loktanella sp. DJP18]|uniref:hypothetical protein n=1 Tax=Loktanella sp. DJP18 TaxID=3409788 RepID=UPI003BB7063C